MKTNQQSRQQRVRSMSTLIALGVFILFGCSQKVFSQWATNGNNINNTNTGNVGVGTTSPDTNAKLHVYNAPAAGVDIQSANAAGWSRIRLVTGTHAYGWFAGDSTSLDAPNKIGLYDYTVGAFRMMVDSSGNVGIGTTAPAYRLHVADTTNLIGANLAYTATSVTAYSGGGGNFYYSHYGLLGNGGCYDYGTLGNCNHPGGKTGLIVQGGAGYVLAGGGTGIYTIGGAGDTTDNGTYSGGGGAGIFAQGGANNNGLGGTYAPAGFFNGYVNIGRSDSRASGLSIGNSLAGPQTPPSGGLYVEGNVGVGTPVPSYKMDVQGGQVNAAGGLCINGDCKTAWSQVGGGGSSGWTDAGATLSVTNSSANVGIGIASPASARLHLYSPSHNYLRIGAPLAYQTSIAFNDDANGQDIVLYRPENTRDFSIWTATASNVVRVTQSGNVGIGTIAPAYKLDVNGEINATGLRINGTPISTGSGGQWTTADSTIYYNGGNVGIGTTTPGSRLDVAGTIRGGNADTNIGNHPTYGTAYAAFWRQGADYSLLTDGTNTLINAPTAAGNIYFRTANTDKMFVQGSTGNVGIGTTSPAAKLHVVGDGKVTGNLTVDGNLAAKYQDVAEWVPATHALPPGTVAVLNPNQSNQVMASAKAYDTRVAGVISERPGIALGEAGKDKVLVATTGRVRVRVDATRAPIHIGDLLVASDKEGMAMKSQPINVGGIKIHRPGTLIGKALEPLEKGTGEILVLLSLQ